MLAKKILRIIMSTGVGVLIFTTAGTILCPLMDPISTGMCTPLTTGIFNMLRTAGIMPITSGTLGGISFYLISGKWINN